MTEKVCRNCGASFMGRSNQNYCSLPECRKASIKASDDKYKGRKRKKQEATVNNSCRKDCRFREQLSGKTYYCNYGEIALREGLSGKPVRGGSVTECKVYETGKKSRRKIKIAATPKKRRAENEVIGYKRDCIGGTV